MDEAEGHAAGLHEQDKTSGHRRPHEPSPLVKRHCCCMIQMGQQEGSDFFVGERWQTWSTTHLTRY